MIRTRLLPNKRYLAEDDVKRRHIQRISISRANAIARLKAAHRDAYKAAKKTYKITKIKEEEERIRKRIISKKIT